MLPVPILFRALSEYIPLEQGLRRVRAEFVTCDLEGLSEYIPLEQGLRLQPISLSNT